MSAILLHAMAVHAVASGHHAVLLAWRSVAGIVPDPVPQAPPGLTHDTDVVLGWGKYGVLACGVAGLLLCGGKMTIGHRNRSALAAEGAASVPYVLLGLSLASASAVLVGVFL
jgi:hypothetical protein